MTTQPRTWPYFLAGERVSEVAALLDVCDKFTGEVAARMALADREGVRFAMEDMTEIRMMVIRGRA